MIQCDKTRTKEVGVLQADLDVRPNVKSRLPSYEDRGWFFVFFLEFGFVGKQMGTEKIRGN